MKIFLISKRLLYFCLILLLLFVLLYFAFYNLPNDVITTSSNIISSEQMDIKLNNITNGKEKIAYLTFDDGPSSHLTPKILDILKAENIKASFFVIGKYVDIYPGIVKRAYEEGHFIANHSYSHNNNSLYKNSEVFINEIKKTDLAIGNAIGINNYSSHIFRFPNGYSSSIHKKKKKKVVNSLQDINYAYVDWNCLNNDSMKKYSNTDLLNNLKDTCKNKTGLIILMHDSGDVNDTSLVLKDSISYLKSEGYKFENFYKIINQEDLIS